MTVSSSFVYFTASHIYPIQIKLLGLTLVCFKSQTISLLFQLNGSRLSKTLKDCCYWFKTTQLILFITYILSQCVPHFSTASHLHHSLIFVDKVGVSQKEKNYDSITTGSKSLPLEWSPVRCSTLVGSSLSHSYQIRVIVK